MVELTVPTKNMLRQTGNKQQQNNTLKSQNVENTKEAMKSFFSCTTADIWSSSKRSYLVVTAHCIDCDTFDRKSVTLTCIVMTKQLS